MYRGTAGSGASSSMLTALTAPPVRRTGKREEPKVTRISMDDMGYPGYEIHTIELNGKRVIFIYSVTPPSGEDDICMVCQESLTKEGMPAVLPSCPQCHTGTCNTPRGLSVWIHAHCARDLLDLNKPFETRCERKHLTGCGGVFFCSSSSFDVVPHSGCLDKGSG